MSAFLSFLGGASRQFVASAEQAEQDAKEMAKASFNGLYKRFEENADSNRELTNKMKAEKQYIETVWSNATPEQVNELLANPVALEAIKKTKNPSAVSLDNYIKVINGNESKAVAAERAAALPDLIERTKESLRPAKKEGYAGFMQGFGETRFDADMEKYARGQGLTLDEMRSNAKMARPVGSATFDMGVLQEAPGSMKEIIDAGEVSRFQAAQKFGKNSDQYKQADTLVKAAESEVVKTDKKIEDRRDRLEIERENNKNDPVIVAALTKEIDGLNKTIQARREATSTKREREGEGGVTLTKATKLMETYMNTDMVTNKGLGWRKFVEEKVVFDPATQKNITIPGKKVDLTPEEEKEYIDGMNAARIQGLKDLGFVTEKGQPVNNEVKSLMTAYGLNRPAQTAAPTQTATPAVAPATPAQPAAPVTRPKPANAPPDAKLAPDGHWYSQDKQTGKYLKWSN